MGCEVTQVCIPVGRSAQALIDAADYDAIIPHTWQISRMGSGIRYARAFIEGHATTMHRLVMRATSGFVVDHINGDGLDNRRENLRLCTQMENMQNRRMHKNNSAGLKGAYKSGRRWVSRITAFGVKKELGIFDTAAEAHIAYVAAAATLHGQFARQHGPSLFLPAHSTKERPPVKLPLRSRQISGTERLILDLLCTGLEPMQIAEQLGRSGNTISTHLKRIRSKLGTRSTIHSAVAYARLMWFANAEYESWGGVFEEDAKP